MSSADRKTFAETHVEYEVRMLVQEVWLLEQLDAKRRGPDDEPRLGADGQALLEAGWPETWGAKSLPPDDDVFSEIDAEIGYDRPVVVPEDHSRALSTGSRPPGRAGSS